MSRHAAWAEALRHAQRALGIGPDKFWKLSVVEWQAVAGGTSPLNIEEFADLRATYPDAVGPRQCGTQKELLEEQVPLD